MLYLCAARIVAITYTKACLLSSEKIEPFYDDIELMVMVENFTSISMMMF